MMISINRLLKNTAFLTAILWLICSTFILSADYKSDNSSSFTHLKIAQNVLSKPLEVTFDILHKSLIASNTDLFLAGSLASSQQNLNADSGFRITAHLPSGSMKYSLEKFLGGAWKLNPYDQLLKTIFTRYLNFSYDQIMTEKSTIEADFTQLISREDFPLLIIQSMSTNSMFNFPNFSMKYADFSIDFIGDYAARYTAGILWFIFKHSSKSFNQSTFAVIVRTPTSTKKCDAVVFNNNSYCILDVKNSLQQKYSTLFDVFVALKDKFSGGSFDSTWKCPYTISDHQTKPVFDTFISIITLQNDQISDHWYLYEEEFYYFISSVYLSIVFNYNDQDGTTHSIQPSDVLYSVHIPNQGNYSMIRLDKNTKYFVEISFEIVPLYLPPSMIGIYSVEKFPNRGIRSIDRILPCVDQKRSKVNTVSLACDSNSFKTTLELMWHIMPQADTPSNPFQHAFFLDGNLVVEFQEFEIWLTVENNRIQSTFACKIDSTLTIYEFIIVKNNSRHSFIATLKKTSQKYIFKFFNQNGEFHKGFDEILVALAKNKLLSKNQISIFNSMSYYRYIQNHTTEMVVNLPNSIFDMARRLFTAELEAIPEKATLSRSWTVDRMFYSFDAIGLTYKLIYIDGWIGVLYLPQKLGSLFIRFGSLEKCLAPVSRFASISNGFLVLHEDKQSRCVEVFGKTISELAILLNRHAILFYHPYTPIQQFSEVDPNLILSKKFTSEEINFYFRSYFLVQSPKMLFKTFDYVCELIQKDKYSPVPLMLQRFHEITASTFCDGNLKELCLGKNIKIYLAKSSKKALDLSNSAKWSSCPFPILSADGTYLFSGRSKEFNFKIDYDNFFKIVETFYMNKFEVIEESPNKFSSLSILLSFLREKELSIDRFLSYSPIQLFAIQHDKSIELNPTLLFKSFTADRLMNMFKSDVQKQTIIEMVSDFFFNYEVSHSNITSVLDLFCADFQRLFFPMQTIKFEKVLDKFLHQQNIFYRVFSETQSIVLVFSKLYSGNGMWFDKKRNVLFQNNSIAEDFKDATKLLEYPVTVRQMLLEFSNILSNVPICGVSFNEFVEFLLYVPPKGRNRPFFFKDQSDVAFYNAVLGVDSPVVPGLWEKISSFHEFKIQLSNLVNDYCLSFYNFEIQNLEFNNWYSLVESVIDDDGTFQTPCGLSKTILFKMNECKVSKVAFNGLNSSQFKTLNDKDDSFDGEFLQVLQRLFKKSKVHVQPIDYDYFSNYINNYNMNLFKSECIVHKFTALLGDSIIQDLTKQSSVFAVDQIQQLSNPKLKRGIIKILLDNNLKIAINKLEYFLHIFNGFELLGCVISSDFDQKLVQLIPKKAVFAASHFKFSVFHYLSLNSLNVVIECLCSEFIKYYTGLSKEIFFEKIYFANRFTQKDISPTILLELDIFNVPDEGAEIFINAMIISETNFAYYLMLFEKSSKIMKYNPLKFNLTLISYEVLPTNSFSCQFRYCNQISHVEIMFNNQQKPVSKSFFIISGEITHSELSEIIIGRFNS